MHILIFLIRSTYSQEFTELDLLEIRLKMDLVTETLYDIICPIIERMFQVNSKCVMMVLEIPQYFNYMLYKNNVSVSI